MTRREREITDRQEILSILDRSKITHIGLVDGDEPYVVPMNYGYTMNEDGKLCLYLHGATQGRKLDVMRKNPNVFFSMECDIQPFEGDVACRYGTAYKSLMGRGKALILDDPREKMKALSIFMKTQTGKDFEFNEKLVKVVSVIRIDVSEYTAKGRNLPKPRE
ncbi:MAG: pyridoxamine 5'-phosphate oxidase family protein [Ruminococcaceae bacterium]|nr:pyridoxamine 5'-phosphate oxidase family protein [Oscillospiraceae bacterium]